MGVERQPSSRGLAALQVFHGEDCSLEYLPPMHMGQACRGRQMRLRWSQGPGLGP